MYEITSVIEGPFCQLFNFSPTPIGLSVSGDEQPMIAGFIAECSFQGFDLPFVWTGSGGLRILDLPPQTFQARVLNLNDAGVISGWMDITGVGTRAFLHDGIRFTSLGVPTGGNHSECHAVNNLGTAVGFWGDSLNGPLPLAFMFRKGSITDLSPLLKSARSSASDINDAGKITGWRGKTGLLVDRQGFILDGDTVADIGSISGGQSSEPVAISEMGFVTGTGTLPLDVFPGFVRHAFLWTPNQMLDIGVLPGAKESFGHDVNDLKQVVGHVTFPNAPSRAFLFQHGFIHDLNDITPGAGVFLESVRGINNAGQIIAFGYLENKDGTMSDGVTVLLSPIKTRVGDVTGDCKVNVNDLLQLLASWGECSGCLSDINKDGNVDQNDLISVLQDWGE